MNEQITMDPKSLKAYVVCVRDVGAGYRGPLLTYSDLACAWAHFIQMISKYPGDPKTLRLYCVGEFYPLKESEPFELYDQMFEVTSDMIKKEDLFDHYVFELFDNLMTKNERSIYTLAIKDPSDKDVILSDDLKKMLTGGDENDDE